MNLPCEAYRTADTYLLAFCAHFWNHDFKMLIGNGRIGLVATSNEPYFTHACELPDFSPSADKVRSRELPGPTLHEVWCEPGIWLNTWLNTWIHWGLRLSLSWIFCVQSLVHSCPNLEMLMYPAHWDSLRLAGCLGGLSRTFFILPDWLKIIFFKNHSRLSLKYGAQPGQPN